MRSNPSTVHDVHIALWRDDTALHAEVADDGRPFDPLSHALPAPPADLRSVPIGGSGHQAYAQLRRSYGLSAVWRDQPADTVIPDPLITSVGHDPLPTRRRQPISVP